MLNFENQNAEYLQYIENYLDKHCFTGLQEPQKELFEAMYEELPESKRRKR